MKTDSIWQYWNQKAEQLGVDPSATMKDVILRGLEIEAILKRLKPDDELLDIGAGNAFGALEWAKHCHRVVATDNSPKMIEAAREAIAAGNQKNIQAEVADVLNLHPYFGQFSIVTCVRCLINLLAEDDQYFAISQMANALRPGGRLFLIEGLQETFAALNEMRQRMQLSTIQLHWHNRLFAQAKLESTLNERFFIDECIDFGEYYFVSRIVHPLLVAPAEPAFNSLPNQVARDVWQSGIARDKFAGISTLMLYVCRLR